MRWPAIALAPSEDFKQLIYHGILKDLGDQGRYSCGRKPHQLWPKSQGPGIRGPRSGPPEAGSDRCL